MDGVKTVAQPVPQAPATDGNALEHWGCSAGPGPPWPTFCGRQENDPPHDAAGQPNCVVCLDIAAAITAGRMACPACGLFINDHK